MYAKPSDQSTVHYLFCDSIKPCEIIIQLSVIYQWPLPAAKHSTTSTNSHMLETEEPNEHNNTQVIPVTNTSTSFIGDYTNLQSQNNSPVDSQYNMNPSVQLSSSASASTSSTQLPSSLLVESYHWHQSKQGDPIKYLETTGNSSISLLLPSSRYSYKLIITAPLGYFITIIGRVRSTILNNSSEQFIEKHISSIKTISSMNLLFGDYDYILTNGIITCPLLIKYYANQCIDSMFNAGQTLEQLINLIEAYDKQIHESVVTTTTTTTQNISNNNNNTELEFIEKVTSLLTNLDVQQNELKQLLSIWPNQKAIKPTLLSILQHLAENSGTPEMNYAWRILQTDFTTINPFQVVYGHETISNPAPLVVTKQKSKVTSSRVEKTNPTVKATAVEESFINRWNRPVDPDMLIAIVRIQSLYRGYRIRNAIRLSQTKYIIETLLSIVNFQHHSNNSNDNNNNNSSVIEKCEFKLNRFIQKRILQRIKRLSTGWMSCLNLLQQGQRQSEAGNKLIERLVVTNSRTSDNNSNFSIQSKSHKDIDSYLSSKEYSGTCSEIPSPCPMHNTGSQLIDNDKCNNNPFHKDWIHLLFRDCIYPSKLLKNECINHQEEVKYSIRLKITISDSYILLVNNDNGEIMRPSIEFPFSWFNLNENNYGYSLLGIVNTTTNNNTSSISSVPITSGKWNLQILGPGIITSEQLPKPLNMNSLNSNFSTIELEDYYEPNDKNLLFRRRIIVNNNDSLLTIHLRLSIPNVFTRLCIKMGNKQLISAEGYGGACIFAYLFMENKTNQQQHLNSTHLLDVTNKVDNMKLNLKEITNSKMLTNKLNNTSRLSPRRSATMKKIVKPGSSSGSSTSGSSTTGSGQSSSSIHSANREQRQNQQSELSPTINLPKSHSLDNQGEEQTREEEQYYWIEAYVDSENWPLSISNWAFLEEQRWIKLEECQVNNTTSRSTSAERSSDSRTIKSATKSSGNKTAGLSNQKSGSTRSASAKIDFNQAHWKMRIICNNPNDIKIINTENKISEIKALKRAWEEMEPGRAKRAELSRANYLQEYGLFNDKLDNKTIMDDTESVVTVKSDDSQIQIIKEDSSIELTSDPAKIYVLTFPQELNRTISQVKPMDLNKFYHKPNEIELKRIKEAENLIGPHTDQWFIVRQYLKQMNLLSSKDLDKILKIKREIFDEFMKKLEIECMNYKQKRSQYQQDYIEMLKTIQFLNDEAHYKYYETCMTYRNNIIKQYKIEKELLSSLNQSTIEPLTESAVVAPVVEECKKRERTKSSRSQKSGSKSRSNSSKRRK
ncbi:unnamed protein product [Schistosoma turkestanicum]|nr:unnamed protein product [Schistosoma turkestanicum]